MSGVFSSEGDGDSGLSSSTTVLELREEVSRAKARAEMLEERLDETMKCNRHLERKVAQAVQLGVSVACLHVHLRVYPVYCITAVDVCFPCSDICASLIFTVFAWCRNLNGEEGVCVTSHSHSL